MATPWISLRRSSTAAILGLAAFAFGCGGGSASEFPRPEGRTLEELAMDAEPSELVVSPSEQVFSPGRSRYGFGVFTVRHGNVPDAQVALYVARPEGKAVGPFPATAAALATAPAFRSETTSGDPDAATAVYTADVELDGDGEWRLMAMFREDDGSYTTTLVPSAVVGRFPDIPEVGEKAPVIHTPTAEDVGGDLTKIDTRQPPDTMHDVDFADAVGKEPVVLLFATPALCMSRVCGPVVDIAEEVKSERPDDAAFIHSEIYTDNDPGKGPNARVRAFSLESEPWLFVIDRDGKVSTRIEGAFSAEELNEAIDKAQ